MLERSSIPPLRTQIVIARKFVWIFPWLPPKNILHFLIFLLMLHRSRIWQRAEIEFVNFFFSFQWCFIFEILLVSFNQTNE